MGQLYYLFDMKGSYYNAGIIAEKRHKDWTGQYHKVYDDAHTLDLFISY